ncbi:D-tyr-tRNA(Tyr) deacylase [Candidatus Nitrospira nitrosa]|uniref:D-aminoacyl-tRNA deacylase n=1 Tax=Candidatus Nitrospira nitrosa TaxID=1742972 RepID=A0A0S4L687_9BACT|nr:D-aminoacyl-tRNA deacylase [Candidatus Nitrospira nitrosa]CUS32173.1 D-tyr-tRNA(Tyr) deacylase [Candidatus Nitrospira nitrosa]
MKAVLQRVTSASVEVDGLVVGRIQQGLMVLLGVAKGDAESDVRYVVDKIRTLRIFSDEQGKMNRSLADVGGAVLLVSQFTLLGRTSNGRRPSFDDAAPSDLAKGLYEQVVTRLRESGTMVETGIFAAHMQVTLVNDGPVTFVLDSREGGFSRLKI